MNKLYSVKYSYRGILLKIKNFWNEADAVKFMKENGKDWKYKLVEDTESNKIWEAE